MEVDSVFGRVVVGKKNYTTPTADLIAYSGSVRTVSQTMSNVLRFLFCRIQSSNRPFFGRTPNRFDEWFVRRALDAVLAPILQNS